MGMSSSATAKPAELATTAQGTLVAYVASSLALEPKWQDYLRMYAIESGLTKSVYIVHTS